MRVIKTITAVITMTLASYSHLVMSADSNSMSGTPESMQTKVANSAVDAVQKKLQITFKNVSPEFMGPGPIKGLYELLVGNKIIYYAPEKNWLLFGAFYSPEGVNQTQQRLSSLLSSRVEALPLKEAITIGNGDTDVIEFLDPDCPYCRKWDRFISTRQDVKRHIFLVPLDRLHPTARGKAVDILCRSDPGQALEDFYKGKAGTDKLIRCPGGEHRLSIHEDAAKKLGVSGTPTLVIAGQVITGFNPARISKLLDQKRSLNNVE